ncbi:hypothetical protein [Paenibacillus larvae]|uniref:hypothetical protein n=1 Tax=Paenibacillus larvae TaxID=1464 RepID=UPI00178C2202|nr:hypothetical protein [Paenibacillus larvae]
MKTVLLYVLSMINRGIVKVAFRSGGSNERGINTYNNREGHYLERIAGILKTIYLILGITIYLEAGDQCDRKTSFIGIPG